MMNMITSQGPPKAQESTISFKKEDFYPNWTHSDSLLSVLACRDVSEYPSIFPFSNNHEEHLSVIEIADQVLDVLGDDGQSELLPNAFDLSMNASLKEEMEPRPVDTSKMRVVSNLNIRDDILYHKETFDILSDTLALLFFPDDKLSFLQSSELSNDKHSVSQKCKRQCEFDDEHSSTKRQKTDDSDSDEARRFRPYQAEQWGERFEELCRFTEEKGHCCVPHTCKENPALARWVKRQRYQYKLKVEGKQSTMTDERIIALENIGFIWDSHGAAWEERLTELTIFYKSNGHCNVPSNYLVNPQLATWVKCQRRQYKLMIEGRTSNMTDERISQMEKLGFEWQLRSLKPSST